MSFDENSNLSGEVREMMQVMLVETTGMSLNPAVDFFVDVHDLTAEFRKLPRTLFWYFQVKAAAEYDLDMAKSRLKELRGQIYGSLKANTAVKQTEASIEAILDSHPDVIAAERVVAESKRIAMTCHGAVETMKAKKDSLVQLGADARKERD
jgi:hypothetical protein